MTTVEEVVEEMAFVLSAKVGQDDGITRLYAIRFNPTYAGLRKRIKAAFTHVELSESLTALAVELNPEGDAEDLHAVVAVRSPNLLGYQHGKESIEGVARAISVGGGSVWTSPFSWALGPRMIPAYLGDDPLTGSPVNPALMEVALKLVLRAKPELSGRVFGMHLNRCADPKATAASLYRWTELQALPKPAHVVGTSYSTVRGSGVFVAFAVDTEHQDQVIVDAIRAQFASDGIEQVSPIFSFHRNKVS